MSTQLEAQAIELIQGFGPEQAGLQPDLFVIGNVVSRSNPLKEEILNRGLPYVSGPQWIGEHILYDKWVLAVWSAPAARPPLQRCWPGLWNTPATIRVS